MTKGYDYLAAPLTALRAGNSRLAIQQLEELAVVNSNVRPTRERMKRRARCSPRSPTSAITPSARTPRPSS